MRKIYILDLKDFLLKILLKTNCHEKKLFCTLSLITVVTVLFIACNQTSSAENTSSIPAINTNTVGHGGYESQVKWGEHLVRFGCGDCHTPKKMGPMGPEDDSSLLLSGHPAQMPPPPIDQKEALKRGLAATQTLTAWVGAWGTSYAANLTPDSTGIGNWKEEQFIKALREGKYKGLDGTRPLLPPMPWPSYRNMTDNEIKAIFAYLKSIKPIHNVVPQATLAMAPGK